MGQYYKPISLDKKEYVYSHDFNNGLKLMEHSYVGNNFVAAVESLLAKDGRWFGNRIVWAGDYADYENPPVPNPNDPDRFMNLFDMIDEDRNDKCKIKPEKSTKIFRYIMNLDTREFVDKKKVPVTEIWENPTTNKTEEIRIHPLPLLTCEGNGRGGGDFYGKSSLIGKWARNRICVSSKKPPKVFKELIFDLVENR